MPSADKQGPDDQVLSRYLLGSLPAEEAERLDELSVADDEFALRLDAVENDLADAYVRGGLSGDTLEQFQRFYLSSPRRREKVEFARTLFRFSEKTASAAAGVTAQPWIQGGKPIDQTLQSQLPRRWFTVPRMNLQWGLAAAALTLLLAGTYLFVENERLRQQAIETRNQQNALNQHAQELESELKEQRAANSGLQEELEGLRASLPGAQAVAAIAVLLAPQTRGVSQLPTISVPPGTNRLRVTLQLEANDFSQYQVALKDPATDHVLWHSDKLRAKPEANSETVSFTLSANLFRTQNYIMELSGVADSGAMEIVSSYPFKVVVQ